MFSIKSLCYPRTLDSAPERLGHPSWFSKKASGYPLPLVFWKMTSSKMWRYKSVPLLQEFLLTGGTMWIFLMAARSLFCLNIVAVACLLSAQIMRLHRP